MQISYKYKVEHMESKAKITELRETLASVGSMQQSNDQFICAVQKFMDIS